MCQLCLYYNDFYDLTLVHSNRELVVRLLQAVGAASIVLAALYSSLPALMIGDGIFVSALFVFVVGILGWRLLFNHLTGSLHLQERMLVVGTGETARKVARQILDQHDFAYRSIGFIDDDAVADRRAHRQSGHRRHAGRHRPRSIAEHHIDRIVVGLSDRRGRLPIDELLRAKMAGVRVEDATTTYERLTGKILIDDLRPSWLIFSDGFRVSRVDALDQARASISSLSLVLAVARRPFMVLTALADLARIRAAGALLPGARRRERPPLHARASSARCGTDAEKGGTPMWATRRRRPRSRASAASSARRGSTSCRSSGTCCAAT